MKNSPKIYVGTAGWSYNDWIPNFYPFQQSKEMSWLRFYAKYFNCVEVNSTYYTYLHSNVIKSWLKQLEDIEDFQFTVKIHQDFTHKRTYTKENITQIKENLNILNEEERLGGILLQFPYSFECDNANIDYMRTLVEVFEEFEKFIEVRHSSWNDKKASTITFCTIDQPQLGKSIKFKPVFSNGKAYLRFHGRNEENWKSSIKNFGKKQSYEERSARYDYLYSPGELVEIDRKLREIYDEVQKVFVIMNNHPHAKAVANAFELLHYLDDRAKVKIPKTTLKAFPRLKEIAV